MRGSVFVLLWIVPLFCAAFEPLPELNPLLERLENSPTGRTLVQGARALAMTRDLNEWIRPAAVSRTDAVLTRVFFPATGKEVRQREVTVYLRMDLSQEDLLHDLAHELTHATQGAAWDPYDPTLTREAYVHRAITGVGGEVDALVSECRVARELGVPPSHVPCDRYFQGSVVLRDRLIKDFYKTGKDAVLFSSTGKAPYPVALAQEYDALMKIACTNTVRRLREAEPESSIFASATHFFEQRCTPKSQ